MSIDVFGRKLPSEKSGGERGLPGVGFKLTEEGHYDMQNKRLCNVASPIQLNEAVNLASLNQNLQNRKDTDEYNKKYQELKNLIDEKMKGLETIEELNKAMVELKKSNDIKLTKQKECGEFIEDYKDVVYNEMQIIKARLGLDIWQRHITEKEPTPIQEELENRLKNYIDEKLNIRKV